MRDMPMIPWRHTPFAPAEPPAHVVSVTLVAGRGAAAAHRRQGNTPRHIPAGRSGSLHARGNIALCSTFVYGRIPRPKAGSYHQAMIRDAACGHPALALASRTAQGIFFDKAIRTSARRLQGRLEATGEPSSGFVYDGAMVVLSDRIDPTFVIGRNGQTHIHLCKRVNP